MSRKQRKQLLDQLDGPCSALALNCCQFGCFIRDIPDADYGSDHNTNWMTRLGQADPSIKLRDLIIPGTHDSASSTIGKTQMFSASGRTQNEDVYHQLHRGVRYIDIRVGGSGGSKEGVSIFHGCLQGQSFASVLKQVVQFMEDNPGEFLIIEIVQEYGRDIQPEQAVYMLDHIKSTLGSKIYTDNTRVKLIDRTTLAELQEAGTTCVVLIHSRLFGFEHDGTTYDEKYIVENYGYFHGGRWMKSKWHNTRDNDQLLEWNLAEVQKEGSNRNKLLCNQMLLTPGVGGAPDVMKLLVGTVSLRPVSFATALYKRDILDNYFREHADEPWNVVSLDFVDLIPALVSFLIALNFPQTMTIKTAAANRGGGDDSSSVDVTDKIQQFVKRDKVLYLTSIHEDLELDFSEGKLVIAYKFDDNGEHHILDVDFDESTEIVLGQYCSNEGCHVYVDKTDCPNEGVFCRGKICSKEEHDSNDKSGTVLEYSKEEDDMTFKIVN